MGPGFESQPDHKSRRQIEVKFCLAFVFQGVMKETNSKSHQIIYELFATNKLPNS